MLRTSYIPYILKFRFEARTSRSVMHEKKTYFIKVWDDENPDVHGIGECNLFEGLSAEDSPEYESLLSRFIEENAVDAMLNSGFSSMIFGIETALHDLKNGGKRVIFPCDWVNGETGIPTNGLVWMGDKDTMLGRIKEKIESGFKCIKIKIGGISFADEIALLAYIRGMFSVDVLQIRLDANGAFTPIDALGKLEQLSKYGIHSIEQPIKPKQWEAMALICRESPIPIALDEELIGVHSLEVKRELLEAIRPNYIILKPALCGGFRHAQEWIDVSMPRGIGWWATSALESNIGLNSIAQWVKSIAPSIDFPQGLGTGMLYENNINSPLLIKGEKLYYDNSVEWGDMPI